MGSSVPKASSSASLQFAVQAHGAGDVFREGLAVVTFADQDVANQAASMHVIDTAARLTARSRQAQEHFADFAPFGAVVPGLRRIDFRMMSFRPGG